MKKQLVFAVSGVLGLATIIGLSGCCTFCKSNRDEGLALITCQPEDKTVTNNQPVKFTVKAKGNIVAYHWFFNDAPAGTNGNAFGIAHASITNIGIYKCEITTTDDDGNFQRTMSREASLGIKTAESRMLSTAYIEHQVMPGPGSGNDWCGGHCSWLAFRNGGGGYYADHPNGRFQLSNDTTHVLMPVANYNLYYRCSDGTTNCATNFDTVTKGFPANVSKSYIFTVYFLPACPPKGQVLTDFCWFE